MCDKRNRMVRIGVSSIVILVVVCAVLLTGGSRRQTVFKAHLKGWYPATPSALKSTLVSLKEQAQRRFSAVIEPNSSIRAMIVPHAGYTYSGDVAVAVYRLVQSASIRRVIVLAPLHNGTLSGIALPSFDRYKTPLGVVSMDQAVIKELKEQPLLSSDKQEKKSLFSTDERWYRDEHSFEIQLPLIQTYLEDVLVVPLLVGSISREETDEVVRVLTRFIDKHTLVIVSSDFTHYGERFQYTPYKELSKHASLTDTVQHEELSEHDSFTDTIQHKEMSGHTFSLSKTTQQRIMQLDFGALQAIQAYDTSGFLNYVEKTGATICGKNAIAVLLALVEKGVFGELESQLIAYKTSAEVTQESDESVSYVGMVFGTKTGTGVSGSAQGAYETGVSDADQEAYKENKASSFLRTDQHSKDAPRAQEKEIFSTKPQTDTSNKSVETHADPLSKDKDQFTVYEKKALLASARAALQKSFEKKISDELLHPPVTPATNAKQGVFVTLYKNKQGEGKKEEKELRGCIGRTSSQEPLYKMVIAMTREAAFKDSRFSPVTADELPDLTISISVLTDPKPVKSYKDIVIGRDGIILNRIDKDGNVKNTALFLPKVATEFGWDLPTTLSELSKKAGLTAGAWQKDDVTYQVFQSIDFSE